VGRHDYVPFGEEIAANSGGRDSTFGTSDFVNQKFTGQERDAETGLDFFQARYFSAALGRFNSPDPGNAGANLFNPQSWNGYSYVNNNPLTLIDPSGTSPFDGFNPSPDDPCADDPFICGYPGFPDFPFPWPSEQRQPPPPPPPPPPAPIEIPHSGGSYAQGQWGSFPNDGETLGLPAGMTIPGPLSAQVLLGLGDSWDCSSGLCVPGFGPLGADAVRQVFSLSPRAGTYKSYALCFVGGIINHTASRASDIYGFGTLSIISGIKGGKWIGPGTDRFGNVSMVQKFAAKWGKKVAVVGATVMAVDLLNAEGPIARGCSESTGYTPWILQ
jgi:RHS repeat-associated protein